jgi:hypothetical protein
LNIRLTWTVKKNNDETYIYWILGELQLHAIRNYKTLISINHIIYKSDAFGSNFNLRYRYKNLFNVVNYIIYGVKA